MQFPKSMLIAEHKTQVSKCSSLLLIAFTLFMTQHLLQFYGNVLLTPLPRKVDISVS